MDIDAVTAITHACEANVTGVLRVTLVTAAARARDLVSMRRLSPTFS